jgi:hypothetical protein
MELGGPPVAASRLDDISADAAVRLQRGHHVYIRMATGKGGDELSEGALATRMQASNAPSKNGIIEQIRGF